MMKHGVLLLMISASFFFRMQAQTAVAPAPKLTGDSKRMLDKDARDAFKHCSISPSEPKDAVLVAGKCLDLGLALRKEAKDESGAHVSFQRSCSLGNWGGCNELGKDLDASGNHHEALDVWQHGACEAQQGCKLSAFASVSSAKPLDLALLEQLGEPLCLDGNDSVCQALANSGVHMDYAAIARSNRDRQVKQLEKRIEDADAAARQWDRSADSSERQQSSTVQSTGIMAGLAATASAGLIATMRYHAEAECQNAESLRRRLEALRSTPVNIPQAYGEAESQSSQSADIHAPGTGFCPTSLAYLAELLPSACADGGKLNQLRDMALATNVAEVVRNVRAQGQSISEAIQQANRQADSAHSQQITVLQIVEQASQRGGRFDPRLHAHTACSSVDGSGDIVTAATGEWIALGMQELVNREVAKRMPDCALSE